MLTKEALNRIVRDGIELTAEIDKNKLFEKLLKTAMEITGCDAGTLYLYRNGALSFKMMKTLSQGVSRGENGETIDLPPVALREENVCAFAAIRRELVNIPDVYSSDRFDFSGPKRYDAITGYRTGSMIVLPLEDAETELIGVLQLMNKTEKDRVVPFTEEDELILRSLGSMTAVSLANMLYIEEIKEQMLSFVQAFATAVDERTPYNGSHTRKVTIYADLLATHINRQHLAGKTEEWFDDNRREQLLLSAALHDIGKMVVPLSVMNKSTRLEERLPFIRQRFELLRALYEADSLKGKISREAFETAEKYLAESLSFIEQTNTAGFLTDESLDRVRKIASRAYDYGDGRTLPYLTEEERDCLLIRKGTLTQSERRVMESHVETTEKILRKVRFNRKYGRVTDFAASHHEFLNGSGYPRHLTAEALPLEARILTVVDTFDALTCTDRPYKKPIPRPRAFAILHDMAAEGKVEERLVQWLEEAVEQVPPEEIERAAATDGWCAIRHE